MSIEIACFFSFAKNKEKEKRTPNKVLNFKLIKQYKFG